MNNWISERRNSDLGNAQRRLFTINNNNFRESTDKLCPFMPDMLHLNSYGLKN